MHHDVDGFQPQSVASSLAAAPALTADGVRVSVPVESEGEKAM